MKNLLRSLPGLLLLTLLTSQLSAGSPNIILILTDDHGWSQTSFKADPRIGESHSQYLETPNMARLAKSGMRFTSGYSPAPLCTPTRRSILCGSSSARCGSEFVSKWIPSDHMTIPKALKAADPDYRCAHFGKWGEQMISTPEECGYDASDGMTGNNTGGMPKSLGIKGGHNDGPPHFINNEDPKLTRSVTARAVDFMKQQSSAGKPFYIQVSYYAQHLSVVCTEELLEKYQKKGTPDRGYPPAWAAMMEDLDDGVGRILDAIEHLGIADNTYVFFTADNGGRGTVPGGNTKRTAPNFPLTGAKHSLEEGGIRVPFLASGPGINPGSVSNTPVVGYDFLPTFHDLAGGKQSKKVLTADVDGTSMKPLFSQPGIKLKRKAGALIFHRPFRSFSAIRKGDYKLMLYWKPDGQVDRHVLYNLGANPTEAGNEITQDNPGLANSLKAELLAFLEQVNAETPLDNPRRKRDNNNTK